MALRARFASHSSSVLHSPASRNFTTRLASKYSPNKVQLNSHNCVGSRRAFTISSVLKDQTQKAPSAKAYLESGVVKGAERPVDVKKVLVIGSGGLSIGQAGEFDYSGL